MIPCTLFDDINTRIIRSLPKNTYKCVYSTCRCARHRDKCIFVYGLSSFNHIDGLEEILEEVRSTVLVWMKNVRNYCTKLYEDLGSPQWFQSPDHPILFQAAVPFDDDISATFIHRMILSDVNIYRYTSRVQRDVKSVDIYVGSRHEYEDACHIRDDCSSFDQINVNFHNTLSSEIKDEICSKLASALRALERVQGLALG